MGACIKLFKLSQPRTGVQIRPSDRRVVHMSQSADTQTVGDLLGDDDLQKWLCSCTYSAMEEWINNKSAHMKRAQPAVPPNHRTSLSALLACSCILQKRHFEQ